MTDTKKNNLTTETVATQVPEASTSTTPESTSTTTDTSAATTATAQEQPTNTATATESVESGNIPAALAGMVSARNVELTRSKRGIPCLWENGGGATNTGEAQLITDKVGNPKRALHIRTCGPLACGEHALVPVQAGDHLVTVKRRWNRVAITVERIASIQEDTATVVPETDPINKAAIDAAITKSRDYHCRRPYYIKED